MKSINQADIAYYLQKTELIAFDRTHCHSIDKRLLKKRKLIIEGLPSTKLIKPFDYPCTSILSKRINNSNHDSPFSVEFLNNKTSFYIDITVYL